MMPSADPFCPGKPIKHDHQFIDQERAIEAVLRCLNKRRSCSIIGGVGMGKTSILLSIKRRFSGKADAAPTTVFRFIPIYFKPNLRKASSLRSIYQQLIAETISQTKDWLGSCVADVPETVSGDLDFSRRVMVESGQTGPDEDYRAFEGDLLEIVKAIRPAVANTKLLFLLDEMYLLEYENTKEDLVRHWFELLDEENLDEGKEKLRHHLAFIVTCLRDHLEQFIPRRPDVGAGPIRNTIEPIYLRVFEREDARKAMKPLFKDTLDRELADEVADEIYDITGGHPLLLQSAMSDLWGEANVGKAINISCVQSYLPTWSTKHPEMYRWIGDMISENQMLGPVLELLLAGGEIWEQSKLTRALERSPVDWRYGYQLQDALRILTSWGVVREVRGHMYQVSGELFREWFEPLSAKGRRTDMGLPVDQQLALMVLTQATQFLFAELGRRLDFWRKKKGEQATPESVEPVSRPDGAVVKLDDLERQIDMQRLLLKKEDIETLMEVIRKKKRRVNALRKQFDDPLTLPTAKADIEAGIKELEEEIGKESDKLEALLEEVYGENSE